jgi:putative PIN family toxin of toxin-antitoxin system
MRVVLDSNVLARATPGKTSAAREVLILLLQTPHFLISSEPLLSELARILQYPRVRRLHGLDDVGIMGFVQLIKVGTVLVSPMSPSPVQTNDPDDDLVTGTAVAGKAEVICTWDRHFFDPSVQTACAAFGVRVLDDVDLLAELKKLSAANP